MESHTNSEVVPPSKGRPLLFSFFIIAIVIAAIVRSAVTTGLDSFTYDEAYHIGAGAAYVQTRDFRLNPEQPPLTKLWTGVYVTLRGYEVSPYRAFADKEDERGWVEEDAYVKNDPFRLQLDARAAMLALNGLLLILFGFAVRRAFGDVVGIAAVAFLAVDPTVAAHMPVVMTDLPVALASGSAIAFAAAGFRIWSIPDLAMAAVSTGLALGAKHSGIITFIAVGGIGLVFAVLVGKGVTFRRRIGRLGAVAGVVLGALLVLWAMYGFRYNESPGIAEETFNRSLQDKISDIRSPAYRGVLSAATTFPVFPRSYIWGMADTIRAGVEGRAIQVKAFGTIYYARAPLYFFPGVVAAKLPIGLLLLSILGLILLIVRRLPVEIWMSLGVVTAFTLIFLAFLMRGSTYAGVRHGLPLFPLVAILGGLAVLAAARMRSRVLYVAVALLALVAVISAVPRMRPWEYFNELAGGPEGSYRYFNDEGVDLSQRIEEAAQFYHAELAPNGELPAFAYFSNSTHMKAYGLDWIGRDPARDDNRFDGETVTGTFIIGANELGEAMWWDVGKPFRSSQPVRRFGNLFVFQGTFERPRAMIARRTFYRTIFQKLYTSEPDIPGAIKGIEDSLALDDSCFFVSLELGNAYLKAADRDGALRAYKMSLERAPKSDTLYDLIAEQVRRIETEPLENISALRNPGIE
jgi:hypothetical protein